MHWSQADIWISAKVSGQGQQLKHHYEHPVDYYILSLNCDEIKVKQLNLSEAGVYMCTLQKIFDPAGIL